jgi:hypothetical protein
MSTFEVVPFREYRAVLSQELVPAPSTVSAASMARDGAKSIALQARYILLKRERLLEALKLYPEQMMSWSRHQRLTERQDSTGLGTDDEGS